MAKVQFKVTSWEEVQVDDDKLPEVIEKIKSGDIRTANDLFEEYEQHASYEGHIPETEVQMTPDNNDGWATIEVRDSAGDDIIHANGKI